MPVTSESEQEWLRVHAYLNRNRHDLAVRAAAGYPAAARVAGTPLLAPPAWRPRFPVPLGDVRLEFREEAPAPRVTDIADIAPGQLPARADGTRYRRYSDVVRELASPAIFENRSTYRLLDADLAGADLAGTGPHLTFTRGRFFDAVDVGGPAAHEFAAAEMGLDRGQPLRHAIGDPWDPAARPGAIAAGALTLRHDRAAGTASFPLHWRDPARVGHAGGMYQVIPVGIFQPSGEAPWNEANDFDLWRGMLREFAEELLGADEDHGSERAPIDYDRWPFARAMTDALRDGRIRAYCLGMGADPLTFALDLLTVVVIDAPLFDDLFGELAERNAEGTVLKPRPLDEPTITELTDREPVQAAGAALLKLAIEHRDALLGDLPAALAPLLEVRALGPEGGVLPVPRIHPGAVRQPVEHLRHHALVQRGEPRRVLLRIPHPAGEQAVAGEQVRSGPTGLIDQRDAARRVPDQVDHRQGRVAEPDGPAVLDELVGRHRDARCVRRVCHRGRPGRRLDVRQRLPVVRMLVRGHDPLHWRVGDHREQPLRLGRRVDQQSLPGAVPEQVGVVLVRPHGDLGHRQAVDLPRVGRPADTHVSGVSHEEESIPAPNPGRPGARLRSPHVIADPVHVPARGGLITARSGTAAGEHVGVIAAAQPGPRMAGWATAAARDHLAGRV
jgi:hypothetical protein